MTMSLENRVDQRSDASDTRPDRREAAAEQINREGDCLNLEPRFRVQCTLANHFTGGASRPLFSAPLTGCDSEDWKQSDQEAPSYAPTTTCSTAYPVLHQCRVGT